MSKATRGYDANKHINGRKRHLLVDQDGLLVDLLVTPADVQDRDAARILLTHLHAELLRDARTVADRVVVGVVVAKYDSPSGGV